MLISRATQSLIPGFEISTPQVQKYSLGVETSIIYTKSIAHFQDLYSYTMNKEERPIIAPFYHD